MSTTSRERMSNDMKAATRQVILDLKKVKEQEGLTCQMIYDLCDTNGEGISESSIRRVFAPGSEDKAADFRPGTLNAILHAEVRARNMALTSAEDAAMKAVVEMNDRAIAEKDAEIRRLTRELEDAHLRLETMTDMFRLAMESIGKATTRCE